MILSEEQQLLKDSAKAFLSESAPISALRAMRDAGEDHMPELWTKMSEMGWPGIVIPRRLFWPRIRLCWCRGCA